jgi:hypothetical protein
VNPPADDLESATSGPHRKHQNGIKSARYRTAAGDDTAALKPAPLPRTPPLRPDRKAIYQALSIRSPPGPPPSTRLSTTRRTGTTWAHDHARLSPHARSSNPRFTPTCDHELRDPGFMGDSDSPTTRHHYRAHRRSQPRRKPRQPLDTNCKEARSVIRPFLRPAPGKPVPRLLAIICTDSNPVFITCYARRHSDDHRPGTLIVSQPAREERPPLGPSALEPQVISQLVQHGRGRSSGAEVRANPPGQAPGSVRPKFYTRTGRVLSPAHVREPTGLDSPAGPPRARLFRRVRTTTTGHGRLEVDAGRYPGDVVRPPPAGHRPQFRAGQLGVLGPAHGFPAARRTVHPDTTTGLSGAVTGRSRSRSRPAAAGHGAAGGAATRR